MKIVPFHVPNSCIPQNEETMEQVNSGGASNDSISGPSDNLPLPSDPSPLLLPPAPIPPAPKDCCGSGCVPCVNDIYDQEVAMWKRECERIRRGERQDEKV